MSTPTNEQLFEMLVKIGRQLVLTNQLLQIKIDAQHVMGKVMAKKLPGVSEGEAQALVAAISVIETDMEQLLLRFSADRHQKASNYFFHTGFLDAGNSF
jgi:hypothetical protein